MEIQMQDFEPVTEGLPPGALMLIAGPCSAESAAQMSEVAASLAPLGVSVLRAGIWKPRTKPGGFEGVGAPGLPWLVSAAHANGMAAATEVGCAAHVNAALDAGVDVLWVGARTTPNPFAVQEIADTIRLSGRNPAVLVKNPVNPDPELWIGAMQRLYNAGIRRLAAVHRGFSCYNPGLYRNAPQWTIPIELHRRLPQLPILFDPSHVAGKSELVAPLARQAVDIGFDGLMIEVHPDPTVALSDARQQLTPAELADLLQGLTIRNRRTDITELDALRSEIDRYDREIIEALAGRMDVSRRIGEYKRDNNLSVLQIERHDSVMKSRVANARSLGLSEDFVGRLMSAIHAESIRHQLEILNSSKQK